MDQWTDAVKSVVRQRELSLSLSLSLLFIASVPVQAETYVAGQIGVNIPNKASNVDIDDPRVVPGTTLTDFSLKTSLAYGAKIGHYFDPLPWLGVELEVFNTNPHVKQQDVTLTDPSGASVTFPGVPGSTLRVTTLAFNVLARYPGKHFQPYAGVGLGIFFAHLDNKAARDSQSSMAPGLNTQLGLRYLATDRVFAFGEWKFNYARADFDPTPGLLGLDATYTAHNVMFGVGYNF